MASTPFKIAVMFLAFGFLMLFFWASASHGDFDFAFNAMAAFLALYTVGFIIAKMAGVGAQPKQPPDPKEWLEHPAWQGEAVEPRTSAKVLRIVLVVASAVAVPATTGAVLVWRHGDVEGPWLYVTIVVFCYPALLAVDAWRRIRSRSLYSDAQLRLDQIPVRPGNALTGTLRIPNRRLIGPVRATLTCNKHLRRNARMSSGTSPKTLWTKVHRVNIADLVEAQDVVTVPIRFDIPADMPGTRPRIATSQTGISWTLEICVSARSLDFEETYKIPIFEGPESAEEAQ